MTREAAGAHWGDLAAILFDLDGTLIAVDQKAPARLAHAVPVFSKLVSSASLQRWIKQLLMWIETPSNYMLAWSERMGVNTDAVFQADRFRRMKGLGTSAKSGLVPGALELLRALQPHYRLAVVTSRSRRAAAQLCQAHGLEGLFEVVTTRQDTWLLKPCAAPVRRTARLLGLPTAACLMVGDTSMDMRAARSAGARSIGVLSGLGDREELHRTGAELILNQVAELWPLLLPGNLAENAPEKG